MFLTEDKVLKKIEQDRQRGDFKKARKRALDALERWPNNYELAMSAVQTCFALSDYHQAVSLLKSTLVRHSQRRGEIMDFARQTFFDSFNPFLGRFFIEAMLKSRDMDRIDEILHASPDSFVKDLIKRSETRSDGLIREGQESSTTFVDNELLLGLLYMHAKQYKQAAGPLGRALERSPGDVQIIGTKFVELERALTRNADIKYYLGLASVLLAHPSKAEARFFQSLELEDPPLAKLSQTIDMMRDPPENHQLLQGEVLIRLGRTEEGTALIREYLTADDHGWDATPSDEIKQLFPGHISRRDLAFKRLSILVEQSEPNAAVTITFCEAAVSLDRLPQAIEAFERLFHEDRESLDAIVSWIEGNETVLSTAPAQKLLSRLYLERGDSEKAAHAAHLAAEMDTTLIPGMIDMVQTAIALPDADVPGLKAILIELFTLAGNAERAEEILQEYRDECGVDNCEVLRLTREIMKHCGVTLEGVISAIETGLSCEDISEVIPFAIEFYREHPESHESFAAEIRRLAEEQPGLWPAVSELVDAMAQEGSPTGTFRFLQAAAHLENGLVERAIFEFDQLLMFDAGIRPELIRLYEKDDARRADNITLNLALYQLHLEEEQFASAAHYLCRTLELDPSQIRDVKERFESLVERDPENGAIWEEMLNTALTMHHIDLAKDILSTAIAKLPEEKAAALHVYGARISKAEGKSEDTLKCLAMTLTSPQPDLITVRQELDEIISQEPENPQARYLLGETLIRLKRETEAVAAFRRCLSLSDTYRVKVAQRLKELLPASIQPWAISRILGTISWQEGHQEDAYRYLAAAQKGPKESLPDLVQALKELTQNAPDDGQITLLYAHTLSLADQHDRAVDILEQLATRDRTAVKAATEILTELLKTHPTHVHANHLLARLLIETGEVAQSLDPVLCMLSNDEADVDELEEIAEEFIHFHEKSGDFLVHYARIKAARGHLDEAISRFREALSTQPELWQRILGEMQDIVWPETCAHQQRLLETDCNLAGNRNVEAFALLREFGTTDDETVEQIKQRLLTLIERNPLKEYFSFGSYLFATSGAIEQAENLVQRGCKCLDEDACLDLKIELGEIFQGSGLTERAAAIFTEVLAAAGDRASVLKRMDHASLNWIELELSRILGRPEQEQISADETGRLVHLALDIERPGNALEILDRSELTGNRRKLMLAKIYGAMERPFTVLAALGGIETESDTELEREMLYMKGIASETIGDYGKAACAFSKIVEIRGEYRDCSRRAEKNYARFIASQLEDTVQILQKTADLRITGDKKGEDES
ncbi:MAG: tetratricopeptide repeat protein [bacterium]|nr:MAG: tetratricopeptide repeat protein [bacterium]